MFKRLPIPFVFILGAGVLLGGIMSFKAMIPYLYWGEMKEFVWYRSALPHVINYLFWPVLVPLIYTTFTHFKLGKGSSLADRVNTIALSLAIPFAHEFFTTLIYFLLLAGLDIFYFSDATWPQVNAAFPGVYIGRIVEFWIIYGLFAAFDYYKKYIDKQAELSRIEAQLNRTKLEVLKMQLQPHFLFNALNTISSLMEIDVKKAQLVTARLGDLLRGILEQDSRVFVNLEEELNYVKTYLDIEKVRFEDRLSIHFDIDSQADGAHVPLLIIQPLVENAIKHGVAKVSRVGNVYVMTKRLEDGVEVVVSDDGKGADLSQGSIFKKGIGLENTRERLKELYGGRASMELQAHPNQGFKVRLIIPNHSSHANH